MGATNPGQNGNEHDAHVVPISENSTRPAYKHPNARLELANPLGRYCAFCDHRDPRKPPSDLAHPHFNWLCEMHARVVLDAHDQIVISSRNPGPLTSQDAAGSEVDAPSSHEQTGKAAEETPGNQRGGWLRTLARWFKLRPTRGVPGPKTT